MSKDKHTVYNCAGALIQAEIIKRPSKKCKTPYVADIICDGREYMAHTPALGCCGLTHNGARVYVLERENKKTCHYSVELSILPSGELVGCNPKMSEHLVEYTIQQNLFAPLKDVQRYKREKKMLNSRFDFWGYDTNGVEFVLEVKTVPLVKYEAEYDCNVSYFPDGYCKKKGDVVSPRALKHIQELQLLKQDRGDKIRCLLCFVIQRNDSDYFRPSNDDPIYKAALFDAHNSGVEVCPIAFEWGSDGSVQYVDRNIPILW